AELGEASNYDPSANTLSFAGYFEYQFLDKESNTLPYKVGTYAGKKSVFNVGLGFYLHPESMQSLGSDGQRQVHDQVLLAADVYADLPLGDRETTGALSAYAVFYNYDFGPNHLRSFGIMNVASAASNVSNNVNGPGNAYPNIGTGQHVYLQAGYLMPPAIFGGWEFMPYMAVQYSILEALEDPMVLVEGGLNWFLQGHHAKITMAYRSRPIFNRNEAGDAVADGRAGEFIIQTMIFL
ncbi:MAG: porin, partial [Myxococcota bacterium]